MPLNNSEIIQLLKDADFDDLEIKKALETLEGSEFDSVMDYIQNVRNEIAQKMEAERLEKIESANKQNQERIKEMEYEEILKKRVLEKIESNRKELNSQFDSSIESTKEVDELKAFFIKIRVSTEDQDLFFGFDENSTLSDLYSQVKSKIPKSEKPIHLFKYGHSKKIEDSSVSIYEYFKAKSVMLSTIEGE